MPLRRSRRKPPAPSTQEPPVVSLTEPPGEDQLPLPHERDESPATPRSTPDPQIVQAERDLASGKRDTDLHGEAATIFAKKRRRRDRVG